MKTKYLILKNDIYIDKITTREDSNIIIKFINFK